MAKNFDLTLLPLYRLHGNELPSPPGLMALTPPRRPARSREKDRLIVHLTLAGNAAYSTVNYLQMTSAAAEEFYKTPGSVTSALRAAATIINGDLLERNMELSGQGRYSVGNLILCALRGDQLYVLEAGPTHVYWMTDDERIHIHDVGLAGRGLGMGQATTVYLSQFPLRADGRLLLTPKLPSAWEQILQRDNHTAPLEILRNALMRQSTEDENGVLVQINAGRGALTVLKPKRQPQPTLEIINKRLEEEPKLADLPPLEPKPIQRSHQPEPLPSHSIVPQAEKTEEKSTQTAPPRHNAGNPEEDWMAAIPRYVEEALEQGEAESKPNRIQPSDKGNKATHVHDVLASIPRRAPEAAPTIAPPPEPVIPEEPEEEIPRGPSAGEEVARKSALALAKGMQVTREGNQKLKTGIEKMLPRLLPSEDENTPVGLPNWSMALIAVVIPLIVVAIATLVYLRLGRDVRYDGYFTQAQEARTRAIGQDDPVAKRLAWEEVLTALNLAEERKTTDDTQILRNEAETQLDSLLNILRLGFRPAINDLPRGIRIKRIVANDSEVFMLDESKGTVLRAYLIGDGYQFDTNFLCEAGNYGGKIIDKLVEINLLPKSNALGASILAFDSQGGLLYCAANETPQAMHLLQPSVGFREITAVTLQSDVLYLLDAASREVWVYGGQASTFINYPTAFFSTETPKGIELAVDLSINDTDLYLLFNDGHLATCTYSLLESVPTRCINPVALVDSNLAAGGGNNFGAALFTEIQISEPPDAAILLLASETQSVFRFSPRSYELLNQMRPRSDGEYALPAVALNAIATNANHTLFIAQDDQVYMTFDAP